jgi:hypothetical protein
MFTSLAVGPSEDGSLVHGGDLRGIEGLKFFSFLADEDGRLSASGRSNHQVLPTIAIHIAPAQAGAWAAETTRQEWLPGPIVERILGVGVPEKRAGLRKERFGLWRNLGDSAFRAALVHLVSAVRLDREHALVAIAPFHFEAKWLARVRREHADGLIARHVAAACDHFLALRDGAAHEANARADSVRVRRQALQPYRDASGARVISIEARD